MINKLDKKKKINSCNKFINNKAPPKMKIVNAKLNFRF